MINNNLTLARNSNTSNNAYAGLLNQGQDYAFYRHIRSRFLQESAKYLGADLSDSKVLSLCFSDYALDTPQANK